MSARYLFSVFLCISSSAAFAVNPPPPSRPTAFRPAPSASGPAPVAGAKAQDFAKVSKEFNEAIADLTAMQDAFAATSSADKKAQIKQKFAAQKKKADALVGQLIAAAEAAYKEAPNADPQVTKVLVGTLLDQIASDDYEPAFTLGKLLMDNKCADPVVPALAGVAAYSVNEYDLAEPWLMAAHASGKLNELCERLKRDDNAEQPRYYIGWPQSIAEAKEYWAQEKKIRDAEAKADDLPRVLLKTSKGDIVVELFEKEAPNTVLNFIALVEKGYYDGVPFHRVLPGFMAQGGDPKGTGEGGPGYTIPDEQTLPEHRMHFRGSLSMANTGQPNSGGSQFFLTFVPTDHLNGKHAVFGRMISGFDVLAKLKRIDPKFSTSGSADKIIEAKVIRKRKHLYDAKDVKKASLHD
jgi:cyclophilin family peptidyl-prolyl cis-trans isomerase